MTLPIGSTKLLAFAYPTSQDVILLRASGRPHRCLRPLDRPSMPGLDAPPPYMSFGPLTPPRFYCGRFRNRQGCLAYRVSLADLVSVRSGTVGSFVWVSRASALHTVTTISCRSGLITMGLYEDLVLRSTPSAVGITCRLLSGFPTGGAARLAAAQD